MKKFAMLAAAFAALTSLGHAQTNIVQTKDFEGIPDFSAPLLFAKYNGNVSDIINVNVSYSLSIDGGQFIIDNDADSPANLTASFGASLDARSSDVRLLDDNFNQIIDDVSALNTGSFSLGPNQGDGLGDYDSSGPDGAILVGMPHNTNGGADVNSMFFGDYAGTGNFSINAKADQVGSLTFNSGIETATTPVNVKGFVTVTYTVVPEPSTAALTGLTVLGLAFRRRRI